jgi:hypothetical protein
MKYLIRAETIYPIAITGPTSIAILEIDLHMLFGGNSTAWQRLGHHLLGDIIFPIPISAD